MTAALSLASGAIGTLFILGLVAAVVAMAHAILNSSECDE